jgi:hypothetical protein
MHYADPLERHRKARIFLGRITELQVAEWLELQGWTVVGLEALGSGPDMETLDPGCQLTRFEVKSIGTEDEEFKMILCSIAGHPAGGVVSPQVAINYLILRVYEAAKQLGRFDPSRVALIVIGAGDWYRFKMQLQDGWVNWANPTFFNAGSDWENFLADQADRYPDLTRELCEVIGSIDALWILKRSSGYRYDLEIKRVFP